MEIIIIVKQNKTRLIWPKLECFWPNTCEDEIPIKSLKKQFQVFRDIYNCYCFYGYRYYKTIWDSHLLINTVSILSIDFVNVTNHMLKTGCECQGSTVITLSKMSFYAFGLDRTRLRYTDSASTCTYFIYAVVTEAQISCQTESMALCFSGLRQFQPVRWENKVQSHRQGLTI